MLGGGCGKNAFGHPGAGGSLGFADPDVKLGFGYVMNRMRLGAELDPRADGLVKAVYRCLEA
jgi:CubicO group peptidase (beta-lactamase class C family)